MKFVLVDTSVWSLAFRKKQLTSDDKKLLDYLSNIDLADIRDRPL